MDLSNQFLPFITFFGLPEQALFWQYVFAILFVVMPLATTFVATYAVKKLVISVRRAFSGDDDYEPRKGYDIKSKSKEV